MSDRTPIPSAVTGDILLPADVLDAMVARAVRGAHAGRGMAARWTHVAAVFAYGRVRARVLCRQYNLDPDEQVGDP